MFHIIIRLYHSKYIFQVCSLTKIYINENTQNTHLREDEETIYTLSNF